MREVKRIKLLFVMKDSIDEILRNKDEKSNFGFLFYFTVFLEVLRS